MGVRVLDSQNSSMNLTQAKRETLLSGYFQIQQDLDPDCLTHNTVVHVTTMPDAELMGRLLDLIKNGANSHAIKAFQETGLPTGQLSTIRILLNAARVSKVTHKALELTSA